MTEAEGGCFRGEFESLDFGFNGVQGAGHEISVIFECGPWMLAHVVIHGFASEILGEEHAFLSRISRRRLAFGPCARDREARKYIADVLESVVGKVSVVVFEKTMSSLT